MKHLVTAIGKRPPRRCHGKLPCQLRAIHKQHPDYRRRSVRALLRLVSRKGSELRVRPANRAVRV